VKGLNARIMLLMTDQVERRAQERNVRWHEHNLRTWRRRHGPDHPQTQSGIVALAQAYLAAGRRADAVTLSAHYVASHDQANGSAHPDMLIARANVGVLQFTAGQLAAGLATLEAAVADMRRIIGPEHPHTVKSEGNLAEAYGMAKRPEDAIALMQDVLPVMERVLAEDDAAAVRAARAFLGVTYCHARRYADAIPLLERVLADEAEAGHPISGAARQHLPIAYLKTGRIREAIEARERMLAESLARNGPDSTITLRARSALTKPYLAAGRVDEAVTVSEQSLADWIRIKGDDDRGTLRARNNLGAAYRDAGRLAEAVPLFERNLADAPRILPADDPLLAVISAKIPPSYGAESQGGELASGSED
jgi:tetratricopeptide (TPR) repeat protein